MAAKINFDCLALRNKCGCASGNLPNVSNFLNAADAVICDFNASSRSGPDETKRQASLNSALDAALKAAVHDAAKYGTEEISTLEPLYNDWVGKDIMEKVDAKGDSFPFRPVIARAKAEAKRIAEEAEEAGRREKALRTAADVKQVTAMTALFQQTTAPEEVDHERTLKEVEETSMTRAQAKKYLDDHRDQLEADTFGLIYGILCDADETSRLFKIAVRYLRNDGQFDWGQFAAAYGAKNGEDKRLILKLKNAGALIGPLLSTEETDMPKAQHELRVWQEGHLQAIEQHQYELAGGGPRALSRKKPFADGEARSLCRLARSVDEADLMGAGTVGRQLAAAKKNMLADSLPATLPVSTADVPIVGGTEVEFGHHKDKDEKTVVWLVDVVDEYGTIKYKMNMSALAKAIVDVENRIGRTERIAQSIKDGLRIAFERGAMSAKGRGNGPRGGGGNGGFSHTGGPQGAGPAPQMSRNQKRQHNQRSQIDELQQQVATLTAKLAGSGF